MKRSFWRYTKYVLLLFFVVWLGLIVKSYFLTDYPIYVDGSQIQNFPIISWQVVTDGRLMRSLQRQARAGKISRLPGTVKPITALQLSSDGYYENMGVRFISLTNEDIVSNKYQEASVRPYQWVSFYRTQIGNDWYYLLVQQWENYDGTEVYIPFILAENMVIWEGQVTKYYQEIVANPTPHFLAPITKYYRKEICIADMGKVSGYCEWRYRNDKRLAIYEELGDVWINSGVLPEWVGKYPLVFTRQYASWEHI